MAHIIFVTSGITSIRNAAFELVRLLQEAGHHITYASPADIGEAVTAQGIAYLPLHNPHENTHAAPHQRKGLAEKLRNWLVKLTSPRAQFEQALQALPSHSFADSVRPLKPDLLIIDIELNAFVIAAAPLGVPVALFGVWVSLYKRPGVPPLHLDIIPGVGWKGSPLGIEWAWLRFRLWKWLIVQQQRVRAVGADPISVLRAYAAQTGFPFAREVDRWQWLLPFSYRTLPFLSANALEFDFPHVPHPAVRYLGPMINLARKDVLSAADQERLDRLLTDDRPLIYCAFGAFFGGDDLAFLQRVVEAAGSLPDYQFIIGLGGRWEAERLGVLPTNVHAFRWVPQLLVLEHADGAVIHGGISSMNECIHFGVPMLVYPFKVNDQIGTAARIGYHRLGIVADRDADTASTIAERIRHLLTDPAYKTAVYKMQAVYEAYRREHRAVHIVEALLTSSDNPS
jgi:zeaxanthin glucosyltransferase